MTKVRVFVPLRKVDEAQRLVYGTMTQEILDKSGEVMDYATSKPNFEKWSGDIAKASGNKSMGNVRAMHGSNACGKVTDMTFDDLNKSIDICAKIVDDGEWNKVLEGVYTGFSVGGQYEKKWNEVVDGVTVKKYTALPFEVSVVDNPCVGTAGFTLVKADGVEAQVDFQIWEPTNDLIATAAGELAKAAGKTEADWGGFVDQARTELKKARGEVEMSAGDEPTAEQVSEITDPPAEVVAEAVSTETAVEEPEGKVTPPGLVQKWTTPDGETFTKKADAEAHMAKAVAVSPEHAALLAATDNLAKAIAGDPVPTIFDDLDRLSKAIQKLAEPQVEDNILRKGMGQVSRFAELLSRFSSLQQVIATETTREGDGSGVAASILDGLKSLGDTFVEHAKEEVAEMLAGMDSVGDSPYCYDYYYNMAKAEGADDLSKDVAEIIDYIKADGDRLEKAGARNAKADATRLQKAHDAIVEAGATCGEDTVDKLAKAATFEQENVSLRKAMGDLAPRVESLIEEVRLLKAQPMPNAATLRVVDKTDDNAQGGSGNGELKEGLEKMMIEQGAEAVAHEMIKFAQRHPRPLVSR